VRCHPQLLKASRWLPRTNLLSRGLLSRALEDKGLSANSALRTHRIISRALKVAVQRGVVARNAAALVDAPAARRPVTPEPLDVEECKLVLAAAKQMRNAARWTVALAVGLRQSEALGLKWTDIDLDRGTLAVRRGLHRVTGQGLVFEEPKTERSRRLLVLPEPLVVELRAHRAAQAREKAVAADYWTDHGLVFTNELGGPIDDRNDYREWQKLLRAAKVRRVRLHDGRHTAATLLLAEGVHPRVVMELLGHSQMRTTTDTYSHVMPALAREAADRMGSALFGAVEPAPTAQQKPTRSRKKRIATKTATKKDEGSRSESESPGQKGGAEGTRTPDPHTASVVRYQLRHSPVVLGTPYRNAAGARRRRGPPACRTW
jgi:integrase